MITKEEYIKLIKKEYPNDYLEIIDGLSKNRYQSFRVNNLKGNKNEVLEYLNTNNIEYEISNLYDNCFIIKSNVNLYDNELFKEGKIYLQSISSQIPPLLMDLETANDILDMCSAPGGKTSLIADLCQNKKSIMAVEANKIRAEKLKYNLNLLGAKANVLVSDASKLDSFFRFDTILLDAPCSGSGTLDLNNPKAFKAFSYDLVKNSAHLQYELLKKAIKILKPNSTMVYSTCSILPIENEEIISRALKEFNIEIVPITFSGLPLLPTKIKGTLLVLPNEYFEGFFEYYLFYY